MAAHRTDPSPSSPSPHTRTLGQEPAGTQRGLKGKAVPFCVHTQGVQSVLCQSPCSQGGANSSCEGSPMLGTAKDSSPGHHSPRHSKLASPRLEA